MDRFFGLPFLPLSSFSFFPSFFPPFFLPRDRGAVGLTGPLSPPFDVLPPCVRSYTLPSGTTMSRRSASFASSLFPLMPLMADYPPPPPPLMLLMTTPSMPRGSISAARRVSSWPAADAVWTCLDAHKKQHLNRYNRYHRHQPSLLSTTPPVPGLTSVTHLIPNFRFFRSNRSPCCFRCCCCRWRRAPSYLWAISSI